MPNFKDILPPPPWNGPPFPKGVWARTVIWKRHKEITHDLEDMANRFTALRNKLPRYLELIEPYAEDWEMAGLRKLLEPFPSTEDIVNAVEIMRNIEWRGLKE